MDLNYILGREQHALHMADASKSRSARAAHRALAAGYGILLAATLFPHKVVLTREQRRDLAGKGEPDAHVSAWESEGGAAR